MACTTIDCTGDVVTGDQIRFTEAVFEGSHRNPKKRGQRTIEAQVLRDSYGAAKQQHTFTLRVLASEGYQPLETGAVVHRKGRNVYRNGVKRTHWPDELPAPGKESDESHWRLYGGISNERAAARSEKHQRGNQARFERDLRRGEVIW